MIFPTISTVAIAATSTTAMILLRGIGKYSLAGFLPEKPRDTSEKVDQAKEKALISETSQRKILILSSGLITLSYLGMVAMSASVIGLSPAGAVSVVALTPLIASIFIKINDDGTITSGNNLMSANRLLLNLIAGAQCLVPIVYASVFGPAQGVWVLATMLAAVALFPSKNVTIPNPEESAEFPAFHIMQHLRKRLFLIFSIEDFPVSQIVNSEFGVLNFYDSNNQKKWTNIRDNLYDINNNIMGSVKLASDKHWFSSDSHIDIFSPQGKLMMTMDNEEEQKDFVFRDADHKQTLAIAKWKWVPRSNGFLSCLDRKIQEWSVHIVNDGAMKEKDIPKIIIPWVLLKHSQKFLPSPRDLNFCSLPIEKILVKS